jgi:hypothetical protein
MKFKYDDNGDARKCVAYIDGDGDLIIKTVEGSIWFDAKGGNVYDFGSWDKEQETAVQKFYHGDKITITF